MSRLKQIQHRNSIQISKTILDLRIDLKSLGHAVRNFPYQASLGILLSSLKLLGHIMIYPILVCISSLLWLMNLMWTKFPEQYKNTMEQVWTFRSTSCRSEDGQKNTVSTQDEWQTSQWNEAGDTHLDYTSTSSETHGEPKEERLDEKIRRYM